MSDTSKQKLVYISDIEQEDFALLLRGLRTLQNYWEQGEYMRIQLGDEAADKEIAAIDALRTQLALAWTKP